MDESFVFRDDMHIYEQKVFDHIQHQPSYHIESVTGIKETARGDEYLVMKP